MELTVIAFLAGVLSITSPCVLPLIPVVLAGSAGSKLRPLIIVAGMSITFTALGVLTAVFREALGSLLAELRTLGIVIIILLGALLASERLAGYFALYSGRLLGRFGTGAGGEGHLGALLLGISLGVVWIPCVGPVLGVVLMLVTKDVVTGGISLFAYSAGLALPMLAVAYLGKLASARLTRFAGYAVYAKKAAGWVLILAGVAFLLNLDRTFQAMLAPYVPELEDWLTAYLK
ncbi:MAG: cytochrome c biogenesis protein CcdA [Euryarchaeota archaeon]|nr:cytochrome c biogenesis protein CcdA [Euryarchaeota archaeon]